MKTVKLKNGGEEVDTLVTVAMFSLRGLMAEKPTVFFDLVMKCRDSKYVLFGEASKVLQDLALLEPDNIPHDSLRNIVLSAVTGDGLEMTLGSPLTEGTE